MLLPSPAEAIRKPLESVVGNVLAFRLLSVLAVCLLAVVAKPILLLLYPSELLSSLFVYAPALFAVQLIEETLFSIMQGFQLYRKMALVQVLAGALNFGLICLFLLVMELGVEGLVLATIVSLSIVSLVRCLLIPGRKALAFDPALM